jgi:predicted ferric reductase
VPPPPGSLTLPVMTATRGSAAPAPLARPRPSPLAAWDPVLLVGLNVAVVTWMWFRHGGPSRTGSFDEWLISIGQLTGLYAALAMLLGLVLISRAPWVERRYGMDQSIRAHRWIGFTAGWLMVAHVTTSTVGLARDTRITLWDQIVDYWRTYPYMVGAIAGLGLFLLLLVASLRAVRSRLSYETWWLIHLVAYAAAALAFGHQTAIGADFVLDRWAWWYWVALYASVAGLVLLHRWVPLVLGLVRRRLRITEVIEEGPGVVTLVVGGRGVDRLAAQAGQFFLLRVLDRQSWWKAHPFSLSSPPDVRSLRFTVKALGDHTRWLQTIRPGTPVAVEGPYGGFLDVLPTERKMLFIAGGIGITPFRGIVEDLDRPGDVALLYRNRTPDEAVFGGDLERLSTELGFDLHMSYSRNGDREDPFAPGQLSKLIPDLRDRDVFVVGSPRLVAAARRGLRLAGVPASRIHVESFTY